MHSLSGSENALFPSFSNLQLAAVLAVVVAAAEADAVDAAGIDAAVSVNEFEAVETAVWSKEYASHDC